MTFPGLERKRFAEAENSALRGPDIEPSLTVPPEYLKQGTVYRFEVLATEEGENQAITEGFFCVDESRRM